MYIRGFGAHPPRAKENAGLIGRRFYISISRRDLDRSDRASRGLVPAEADAEGVQELAVREGRARVAALVEEELVLDAEVDEGRRVHEELDARLGGREPAVLDAVAVDVADVATDVRLPAAEVKV